MIHDIVRLKIQIYIFLFPSKKCFYFMLHDCTLVLFFVLPLRVLYTKNKNKYSNCFVRFKNKIFHYTPTENYI